jgi:hypothetical protein
MSLFGLAVATAGLAVALGVGAPDPGAAERAYAAAAGLLLIVALVRRLGLGPFTTGSVRATAGGPDDDAGDPALARWLDLERALRLGTLAAGDFDLLVRPRLAALARSRRPRAGSVSRTAAVDLADPAQFAGVLAPGSPRLADRSGPGIPLEEVEAIVTSLENR